jgi:hypothetical protein
MTLSCHLSTVRQRSLGPARSMAPAASTMRRRISTRMKFFDPVRFLRSDSIDFPCG